MFAPPGRWRRWRKLVAAVRRFLRLAGDRPIRSARSVEFPQSVVGVLAAGRAFERDWRRNQRPGFYSEDFDRLVDALDQLEAAIPGGVARDLERWLQ